MPWIRLYLDEDSMHRGLVAALRARGVDVMTASEAGMVNRSDEDHLRWATKQGRVLYSFNMGDYSSLHRQWLAAGEVHGGIILAAQQRHTIGEELRRLLRLINESTPAGMRGALEYLSSWGR